MIKSNIGITWNTISMLLDGAAAYWKSVAEQASRRNPPRCVSVKVYNSTGITIFARKATENTYDLFVPVGCFDRVFLLALLFMSGIKIDPISIVSSLRDKHLLEPYIPERLAPIFRPTHDTFPSLSKELIEAYRQQYIVPTFLPDVILISTCFLAHHELAHLVNNHFEMREMLETGTPFPYTDETLGMSKQEIMEGFEVHADQEASTYTARVIWGIAREAAQDEQELASRLMNCAIGLALTVTLFDYKSRSLETKGDGYYPHPLVRWTLIHGAIAETLDRVLGDKELSELFHQAALIAANSVTKFLHGLLMTEIQYEAANGKPYPLETITPLAQLNSDQSLFGESVMFEHVIQSVERGKRVVFLGKLMGIDMNLNQQWKASPEERLKNFMDRVRIIKDRTS